MATRSETSGGVVVQNRGGSRVGIIVAIGLILVIFLAVILYFLLRKSNTSSSTGNTIKRCGLDTDCTGTQVCSPTLGVCVDCVVDGDCPISRPLCDIDKNTCVGCIDGTDCNTSKPICDSLTNQCVGCETAADCSDPTPFCNDATRTCVGCITNNECDLNSPYCNAANNQCVECTNNAQCTAPTTCNNGLCCDRSAPNIISLVTQNCNLPGGLSIVVNYGFPISAINPIAIFEIADSTGFPLSTTTGVVATGTHVLKVPIQVGSLVNPPIFYAGYSYQIRVRISQECGLSPYSDFMSIGIPTPATPVPLPYVPIITSIENITVNGFRIRTNPPLGSDISSFGNMAVYLFNPGELALDPNRARILSNTNGFVAGNGRIDATFPFVAVSGASYYVRVALNAGCGIGVVSGPVPFIVP